MSVCCCKWRDNGGSESQSEEGISGIWSDEDGVKELRAGYECKEAIV